MNMDQLKELVTLHKRKEALTTELEQTATRMDELKDSLLPQFLSKGLQSMRIDGRLVSITQDVYASPAEDRPAVCKALCEADLSDFVEANYNTNTVKAYVRELAREVKEDCLREQRLFDEEALRARLPAPLRNALRIGLLHTLRVLKG
jgi:hypothetical protein